MARDLNLALTYRIMKSCFAKFCAPTLSGQRGANSTFAMNRQLEKNRSVICAVLQFVVCRTLSSDFESGRLPIRETVISVYFGYA